MTETKDVAKAYPLPSGAVLHLERPRFADAARLRNAITRALGSRPFAADELKMGMSELKANPSAGGALLQRLLSMVASEEVEACLFACLRGGTYQPADAPAARIKVDAALFDDDRFGEAATRDYYPICWRVVEVAVLPFLGALVSMFKAHLKTGDSAPASPPTSGPKDS